MRFFHLITIFALLLYAINWTIPIWIATLSGHDSFIILMTSVLGWPEQVMDLIISTAVIILGCIAFITMLKRRRLP